MLCSQCKQCLALSDINALASASGYQILKTTALSKYIREHANEVRRCPNHHCSQLLDLRSVRNPVNEEEEIALGGVTAFCDECNVKVNLFCSRNEVEVVCVIYKFIHFCKSLSRFVSSLIY